MASDPLRTPLCDRLGIDVPILLAGMGGIALSELAAAVCEARGLGFIGGVGLSKKKLSREIERAKGLTKRPFGVDLFVPQPASEEEMQRMAGPLLAEMPKQLAETLDGFLNVREMVEMVIDSGVSYFASALGNPAWMVGQAHDAGMTVLALVGTVRHAVASAEAGVDILIAQGYDAGGHTGRVGTFSLVPQIVDAVEVPVVAAGGIVDGRGVAAALALGAQGVWMGTRFVATREARAAEAYKRRIVEIGDEDTTITRSYTGKTARMIKNKWTAEWEGREDEIKPFPLQLLTTSVALKGKSPEDIDWMPMAAGQASGLVHDLPSAGEVLHTVADEAREVLARMGGAGAG